MDDNWEVAQLTFAPPQREITVVCIPRGHGDDTVVRFSAVRHLVVRPTGARMGWTFGISPVEGRSGGIASYALHDQSQNSLSFQFSEASIARISARPAEEAKDLTPHEVHNGDWLIEVTDVTDLEHPLTLRSQFTDQHGVSRVIPMLRRSAAQGGFWPVA